MLRLIAAALTVLVSSPAFAVCPFGPSVRRIVSCRDGVPTSVCRRVASRIGCNVVRELELINAIVIEIPEESSEPSERNLKSAPEVERLDPDFRVNWLKGSTLGEFRLPGAREILSHEPLRPGPRPAAPAADPEQPWGIRRVNASAAWARTQGEGVKVAVIDTGIDSTHPDLRGAVAGGWNAVDPEHRDNFKDDQGHGTHVAGTIAAIKNGEGVVGVAPKAKLYAVKVLDADGNGSYSDVIAGIDWCAKNRIQVANMSLGADEASEPLRKAVARAALAGVTIVAAAGNSGGPVSYPGVYPEAIAVSASDSADKLAEFSSRGPEVALIAPGVGVKSLAPGGGYATHDGTSMAAPHVAGLAALAVAGGARGHSQVRAALQNAAGLLPGLKSTEQGKGMVDAGKIR